MKLVGRLVRFLALGGLQLAAAAPSTDDPRAKCPGYKVSNVKTEGSKIEADLHLAGAKCDAFGKDLENLKLDVTIETSERIHVKIYDAEERAYQVPESVFPRPKSRELNGAFLKFEYKENPFSFTIIRTKTREILFDSSAAGLIFEDQYLRLRTRLPENANLYGLGEHSDSLRLKTTNYTRTLWNADTPSIPETWNLYGSHPIYIEHRTTGSHGVFLLSSNGMDVVIHKDQSSQYLEYNVLGGVFDLYFMAGPSPIDVAKQYSEIAGLPVTVPYAGLGFHQCRWGYRDIYNIAEVVYNYSKAGIPLETMWTDIDYMDGRAIFSVDPERYPLTQMQQLVAHLHENHQKYVLMVDPAVAVKYYGPYIEGYKNDIFLLNSSKEVFHGVVWPGLTAYPDWFAKGVQQYWNDHFAAFFHPTTGIDIDYLWIDMNEPSNFCDYPCLSPEEAAEGYPPTPPPVRQPPRELPGWPCEFQPPGTQCRRQEAEQRLTYPGNPAVGAQPQQSPPDTEVDTGTHDDGLTSGKWKGLPGRELIDPPYKISNGWGPLPHKSINTSLIHQNGLTLFDTHNLYGTMMSAASRTAMLARRPKNRPLVITRSTFAGAGSHVSHWLGDNDSSWPHYLVSIRQMLQFNSIFQVSMVGSDVCGFNGDTTEELCARWAMLGAFQPFYRNHNAEPQVDQEFYRWESVTKAAKKAIDIRYRLLDYFYTAMMKQSADGTPALNPMFYLYPNDEATFGLDVQFFWGPSLLVAPVTKKGSTSVDIYLPDDIFYDFYTHEQIRGEAKWITKSDQSVTDIPLFLRGGVIVPIRRKSAMTTTELREQHFELLIPVGKDGKARGSLYLDDGDSIDPKDTSLIEFEYENGQLRASGSWKYKSKAKLAAVTVLNGGNSKSQSAETPNSATVAVDQELSQDFTLYL